MNWEEWVGTVAWIVMLTGFRGAGDLGDHLESEALVA